MSADVLRRYSTAPRLRTVTVRTARVLARERANRIFLDAMMRAIADAQPKEDDALRLRSATHAPRLFSYRRSKATKVAERQTIFCVRGMRMAQIDPLQTIAVAI